MTPSPLEKRPYTLRDRELARVFVRQYFPGEVAEFQAPLYDVRGIDPKMLKTFGVHFFERAMPRADVLIITPEKVIIAEVKSRPLPRDVAQLEFYIDALRHDVIRRTDILGKPIEAYFVAGREDARVEALCRAKGIKFVLIPWP